MNFGYFCLKHLPVILAGTVGIGTILINQPSPLASLPSQSLQPVIPSIPNHNIANSSSMQQEMLNAHNQWRAKVGVPPLQWSNELASYAQEWANKLAAQGAFEHRRDGQYGENLFMGSGRQFSPTEVVDDWGSEVTDYDYASNNCRSVCGHYTQIVWKDTTEVGCGVAHSGNREVWCDSFSLN